MGRISTSTKGGTALGYAYDALGRNTRFTDQAGRTSTYAYDLAGNRTSTTYPGGVTVNRAHDGSNRVTALKDGSGNLQAAYDYDSLDRPTGMTLGNGTSVAYNYDLLNRVTSVNNTLGGTVTRNYAYVYDAASRVTSITEPRGTIGSGYTDRNEVSSITEPSGSPFADQGFAYDAGYNRSQWTNGTTSTNYAVNNLNQYTAVAGASPSWNGDGGLSSFAGNTYSYDALGRLTQVGNAGGIYVFSYDPLGRRVKKIIETTGGTVLQTYAYHYDGSEVAVEYQPSVTWTYYLGLGIDQPVMRTDGTNKQWYYANAQGSISAVADNSGTILEQYEYNAQGQFQVQNGSGTTQAVTRIGNFILYTGRNYDYETGNYFYRARYYSPVLGRFVSRDPLSGAEFSQGNNLYAYCGNNFLNASDPTGMCLKKLEEDASAFWNGFTDPNAWQQSAAATIDGMETLGGLAPWSGSFNIDSGNQYNQNISMDLGGVGDAAFGSAMAVMGWTAAGGATMDISATTSASGDFHMFSSITDEGEATFLHGSGDPMAITESPGLAGFQTYTNTLSGIPIVSPGAATATVGTAINSPLGCVAAVGYIASKAFGF